MRTRPLLAALMLGTLAGCIPSTTPPPAPPPPRPAPVATPAPPPPPVSSDWRDWPLTPGDWRYAGGVATFGPAGAPVFTIACGSDRRVTLTRAVPDGATMAIRTTSRSQTLATANGGGSAVLPARDPLLDAIGFSRGRFIVQGVAAQPLVIPAWPEILRVIEDCRS
ncbi:hypothetical protein LZK98_19050 [Sphingomonas cannabina]|uniref:hypothetical protein n=1 Tax=Sphingomonas cannabina TaxID=2899123 RepID=UPI001F45F945|nr:hypothetical protein [Sphingomonas cannabina]UIJ45116.1 hypothetical protein LZK98_19050 [Sphingomonas cannabina]